MLAVLARAQVEFDNYVYASVWKNSMNAVRVRD